MKKTIDLKQLQYFVAVYEYGSLLSAAKHVGVGQPALTKSLKNLEAYLGLQLFTRHSRELTATMPAHDLYKRAQQVLAEAQSFHTAAEQIASGIQGAVTMGCGPLPSDILLVPLIESLNAQGANINLEVKTESFDKLLHGLLVYDYDFLLFDAGKLEELPDPERFTMTPLFSVPVDVVVSQALHESLKSMDFKAVFSSLKWVATSEQPPKRIMDQFPPVFQHIIQQQGSAQYQIESIHTCLSIVRAGLAATFVPRHMVKEEIASGALVQIPLPFELNVKIGAYQLRARSINATARKVVAVLEELSKGMAFV